MSFVFWLQKLHWSQRLLLCLSSIEMYCPYDFEKSNTNLLLSQQLNERFKDIKLCYDFDETLEIRQWRDISLGQISGIYLKDFDYFLFFLEEYIFSLFRRINNFINMCQRYENFIPRKVYRCPCLMHVVNQYTTRKQLLLFISSRNHIIQLHSKRASFQFTSLK